VAEDATRHVRAALPFAKYVHLDLKTLDGPNDTRAKTAELLGVSGEAIERALNSGDKVIEQQRRAARLYA
jgi:hypothetical protein